MNAEKRWKLSNFCPKYDPKSTPKSMQKLMQKKSPFLDPLWKSAHLPSAPIFLPPPWQPPLRGSRYTTVHFVPLRFTALPVIRRPLVVRVRPPWGEGLPSPLPLSQGHFSRPSQKSRNVSRILHTSQKTPTPGGGGPLMQFELEGECIEDFMHMFLCICTARAKTMYK